MWPGGCSVRPPQPVPRPRCMSGSCRRRGRSFGYPGLPVRESVPSLFALTWLSRASLPGTGSRMHCQQSITAVPCRDRTNRSAREGDTAMTDGYDAITIGSGLGGLTAAALYARAGHRVLVLERNDDFGGAATTYRHGALTIEGSLHQTSGFSFPECSAGGSAPEPAPAGPSRAIVASTRREGLGSR
ncbi:MULTISPECIES: NAD(P)-binding protein [Rhodococcus]|nr:MULTISPECIES: NAD(P)-binding protein [Rhodococcus]